MTDQPLSRLAVGRGAAMALILAMPAALANVVLADQDPKPRAALNLTLLVLLVAFAVGGSLAGREAPPTRRSTAPSPPSSPSSRSR